MIEFEVVLNGTDTNPYAKYGLKQNPFPQIADAKYTNGILQVQKLAGDPIPDIEYIKNVLAGFSKEFVELCCNNFKKGEMVRFKVKFNE